MLLEDALVAAVRGVLRKKGGAFPFSWKERYVVVEAGDANRRSVLTTMEYPGGQLHKSYVLSDIRADRPCGELEDLPRVVGCLMPHHDQVPSFGFGRLHVRDGGSGNYNVNATTDDGSCTSDSNTVPGCTDPAATNYDADADSDDGSCVLPLDGCTTDTAYNYNANATNDDGSCTFLGCCADASAENYAGASACDSTTGNTVDPNSDQCISEVIEGCMDSESTNFSSVATVSQPIFCTYAVKGCTDSTKFNYQSGAEVDDGSCIDFTVGCIDPTAINYNSGANVADASCEFAGPPSMPPIPPAPSPAPNVPPSPPGAATISIALAVGATAFVQADQAALVTAFATFVNLPESDVEVISVTGNPATLVLRVTEGPQWARVMAKVRDTLTTASSCFDNLGGVVCSAAPTVTLAQPWPPSAPPPSAPPAPPPAPSPSPPGVSTIRIAADGALTAAEIEAVLVKLAAHVGLDRSRLDLDSVITTTERTTMVIRIQDGPGWAEAQLAADALNADTCSDALEIKCAFAPVVENLISFPAPPPPAKKSAVEAAREAAAAFQEATGINPLIIMGAVLGGCCCCIGLCICICVYRRQAKKQSELEKKLEAQGARLSRQVTQKITHKAPAEQKAAGTAPSKLTESRETAAYADAVRV